MSESLHGCRVALAEGRQLVELAELLEKEGATTLRCPLLSILDAPDAGPVVAWVRDLIADRFAFVVLLTGEGVRRLKALYPDAAVVCYINSTAEVKAESDVCVTSGNVYDIIARLPERRILFVPDRLMAENVRAELKRRGVDKEIVSSDGTCIVHDQFDPAFIAEARSRFPGLKVVAHPECTAEVAAAADFVGSTGAMMKYVKNTPAPYFLMLTECGLVGRLQVEDPEKRFIGGCRLCPYMKLNSLEKVHQALAAPRPDQIVTLDEDLRRRAARSIERMFELTPKN